ncbi:DNA internalization-related competence protein ComEC/Rec2 [Hydrogenophaga sp. XSHU_21]
MSQVAVGRALARTWAMLARPAPQGDDGIRPRPWRLGWWLAGWVAGTALMMHLPVLWTTRAFVAVGAGGLVVLAWRARPGWWLSGLALAFAVAGLRAGHLQADQLDPALEGRDVQVVGRVASLPQQDASGDRFEFVIERADLAGAPVALPSRVLLGWYRGLQHGGEAGWSLAEGSPGLRVGDRWSLPVRLKRPHGAVNPHGFDRERWLREQGIGATGHVRTGARAPPAERLGASPWHPIDRARQALSQAIDARLGDRRAAGVIAALVVGDQAAIERADWTLFRDSATAHLMAVSGMHITLFAWLATGLLALAWRVLGRHWPALPMRWPATHAAGWGGVLCATAYALLAGWGVPAQRTVLMLMVVVALRLSVRRWPWPAVWLLAMALVLMLDPWAWLSPGFWLSFVAVAVLFSAGSLRHGEAPRGLRDRLGRPLRALLREQALMTVALAPLGLLLFGQFSVVGLAANLIAIPWVTLLVTPLALLGVLWPWLWSLAAWAVDAMGVVLQAMVAWPMAVVHRPALPGWLGLAAVIGGALAALRCPPQLRVAGLLLVVPALCWTPPRPPSGVFEVLAIDVGQGSAVLVRTATHDLLYDSGPRWNPEADAGDRVVIPLLRALGAHPDVVVISHRDSDHSGGASAVQAAYPEARWLSSYDDDPARRCLAGQRWRWDGVDFEVLHPGPVHYANAALSTNAMSCVLRIVAPGGTAWLAGDIPAEQETALALARPDERATLLLAPHHGSKTSSSPVLLNTLQPHRVVVQSGYRNRFGHPARGVIDRYEARGIAWIDTPRCGAATWRSDAPDALRCERQVQRRHWRHPDSGHPAPLAGPDLAMLPTGEEQP